MLFFTPHPHLVSQSNQFLISLIFFFLFKYLVSLGNTSNCGSDLAFMLTEAGVCCLYSVKNSLQWMALSAGQLCCHVKDEVFFPLAHKPPAQPVHLLLFHPHQGVCLSSYPHWAVCVWIVLTHSSPSISVTLLPLALCSRILKLACFVLFSLVVILRLTLLFLFMPTLSVMGMSKMPSWVVRMLIR